jgi:hypothetical protein
MSRLLAAKLDLADSLNPVLVRNLRQALRSNILALTLCINQYIIAIIFVIFYLWINEYPSEARHANLGYVIRILMYIFPFYTSRIIDEEVKTKTLETLLLVNSAPTMIVYGNWQTLVTLSTVITFSYLPYTVLHFYSRSSSFISLSDIYYAIAITHLCRSSLFMFVRFVPNYLSASRHIFNSYIIKRVCDNCDAQNVHLLHETTPGGSKKRRSVRAYISPNEAAII